MNIRYAISNRERMICCSTARTKRTFVNVLRLTLNILSTQSIQMMNNRDLCRVPKWSFIPLEQSPERWSISIERLTVDSVKALKTIDTGAVLSIKSTDGREEHVGRRRSRRRATTDIEENICSGDVRRSWSFLSSSEQKEKKNISLPSKEKTYLIAMARLSLGAPSAQRSWR